MKRRVPVAILSLLLIVIVVACAPSRLTMTLQEVQRPSEPAAQACPLEQSAAEEEVEILGSTMSSGTTHPPSELGTDFYQYIPGDEAGPVSCSYIGKKARVAVYAIPSCVGDPITFLTNEAVATIPHSEDVLAVIRGIPSDNPTLFEVGYVRRVDLWGVCEDLSEEPLTEIHATTDLCECFTKTGFVPHSAHPH